jgi:hypothetical protein
MKIAIIGDSFTHTYKNTWIEQVCSELDLTVIHHVGFSGKAQYRIYLEFLEVIKNNPDVIICCHTSYNRLYHPSEILQPHENMEKFIRNPNIKTATKFYFDYLYQENFARYIFNSIIVNMQQICQEKNIKLVNIPCFEHDFINKIYGLWLSSANGLIECCRIDYNSTYGESWNIANDPRRNHFSPNGHKILADNIIPHIKTYITTDQEFHISLLYPELFA